MNFEGKVALITGGAAGIGKSIATEFKDCGAKTVIIDKDNSKPECDLFFCGDIAEQDVLIRFAETVKKEFGEIDFIINNAGTSKKGIISNCSYDDFLYVQKVGVLAPYMLAKLFFDSINPGSAVVNISSTRSKMSQPDTESYSAAKGAVDALTHSLAVSLAGKVRVNSVSPGWIDTANSNLSEKDKAQHPAGRVGESKDIAKIVLFLCSEDAAFINGQNITVDGGMSTQMIYHNNFGWKLT